MTEDLGAQLHRLTQRVIAAERPLLERRGLSMWAYIALSYLAAEPAPTQLHLATAIGYDKTRLIALLESLEADGLITRARDERDRRAQVVRITAAGRRRHRGAVAAIRAMETQLLAPLTAEQRAALRAALQRLSLRPCGDTGGTSACR